MLRKTLDDFCNGKTNFELKIISFSKENLAFQIKAVVIIFIVIVFILNSKNSTKSVKIKETRH